MRRLLSIPALLALSVCGGEGEISEPLGTVSVLESPAGEGSGEAFLSTSGDKIYLSWLQESDGGGYDLLLADFRDGAWSAVRAVVHRDDFFVNWADFPSVVPDESGRLWAHWLQRGADGGYDYGIRIAHSADAGTTWSEPWTPHEDGTPTEHGFVSLIPLGGGMALSWLDGRKFAPGPDGAIATEEMTVRFRALDSSGIPGPEILLDDRSCDCCQTATALAADGPVVVYRDRTQDEIRDISITRWTEEGWTAGTPIHEDGWHIAGCPVNGPAVAAQGDTVVVAWFTGAQNEPRVYVAYSEDGGASFGAPIQVDKGRPTGRVDLVLRGDGTALVSWVEESGAEGGSLLLRRVTPNGSTEGEPTTLARMSTARASGFPRMVESDTGALMVAWTEVGPESTRVRVATVEMHR